MNMWMQAAGIFLLAIIVYAQYGFQGTLVKDSGHILYASQQALRGFPPYISTVEPKAPLSMLVPVPALALAEWLGRDAILTARQEFLAIGALTVATLYLACVQFGQSRRMGLLAALSFLGFFGYGQQAASGPGQKTPFALFVTLWLWAAGARRWFWAGLAASTLTMSWQPMGFFALATLALAWAQSEVGRERRRSVGWACVGLAIPVAGVLVYYWERGALDALYLNAFIFPLRYAEHIPVSAFGRVERILAAIYEGFPQMAAAILLGVTALAVALYGRMRASRGLRRVVQGDALSGILLTFPLVILWSLIDFQRFPDFFVVLPYAAFGFAWILEAAIANTAISAQPNSGVIAKAMTWGSCLALTVSAFSMYRLGSEKGLLVQRQEARQVENEYLDVEGPLLAPGAPEILAILGRNSPTSHNHLGGGEYNLINLEYADGVEQWLGDLLTPDRRVVIVGRLSPREFREQILSILTEHGYELAAEMSTWTIYAKP